MKTEKIQYFQFFIKRSILLFTHCFLFTFLNAQTIPSGLINYWPFDGNAIDLIGSNNGTIYGGVSPTQGIGGIDSTALHFNGAGSYIRVNAQIPRNITFAFWFKAENNVGDERFISGLDGGSSAISLIHYSKALVLWYPYKIVVPRFDTDKPIWSFLVLSIDQNQNVTTYFNGQKVNTQNFIFSNSASWGIGGRLLNAYGSFFKGSMDEFMVFDHPLTESEVLQLYNGNKPYDVTFDLPNLFHNDGKIGISTPFPDELLTVNDVIHAEQLKIDSSVPVPDFVFEKSYDLKTLEWIENYIKENGHLPDIPPASTIEKEGINIEQMDMALLQKVEELTLYIIGQEKQIKEIEKNIETLNISESEIKSLTEKINFLKKKAGQMQ